MDFLFSTEYWHALLSPQMQASLTEKLIVVAVVWAAMGKKVDKKFGELNKISQETLEMFSKHLKSVQSQLAEVVTEIKAMKEAMVAEAESNHRRIEGVETGLQEVKTEIDGIKTKLKSSP